MQIALRSSDEDGQTVVHVAGSLGAVGVPVLWAAVETSDRGATLDLRELVAASADGIAALRAMLERGHRLRNASPCVLLRLTESTGPNEAPRDTGERP